MHEGRQQRAERIGPQGAHIDVPAAQQGGIRSGGRYTTGRGGVQAQARVGPQNALDLPRRALERHWQPPWDRLGPRETACGPLVEGVALNKNYTTEA
ncbi:hypothetical protein NDU88_007485 [Pleurodeles waltl]|uniref:Uncharacterized protein n=1 Tax=Pleurodeles waltl TaxID=8319 RepID=A0AAV7RT67_PLEWA|nr:hypothetical protein NDU88_007485 [Pleurodeles waltl]